MDEPKPSDTTNTSTTKPKPGRKENRDNLNKRNARWLSRKKAEDSILTASINSKLAVLNLPSVSLTIPHQCTFKGKKRPDYNPPPEMAKNMTPEQITEWKKEQRKKRKAEKQRENRMRKKQMREDMQKMLPELEKEVQQVEKGGEVEGVKVSSKSIGLYEQFMSAVQAPMKTPEEDVSSVASFEAVIKTVVEPNESTTEDNFSLSNEMNVECKEPPQVVNTPKMMDTEDVSVASFDAVLKTVVEPDESKLEMDDSSVSNKEVRVIDLTEDAPKTNLDQLEECKAGLVNLECEGENNLDESIYDFVDDSSFISTKSFCDTSNHEEFDFKMIDFMEECVANSTSGNSFDFGMNGDLGPDDDTSAIGDSNFDVRDYELLMS